MPSGVPVFRRGYAGRYSQGFAQTLFAANQEYVGYNSFGKNGKDLFYAITNSDWSTSIIIRVNAGGASEWHISMTKDNMAYFSTEREAWTSTLHGDIYQVRLVGEDFTVLKKFPGPVNTKYNDSDHLLPQTVAG